MGLDRDGCNKILGGGGQDRGIEGKGMLDGPQRGKDAARKSSGIDGCRGSHLDGPQQGVAAGSRQEGGKMLPKKINLYRRTSESGGWSRNKQEI